MYSHFCKFFSLKNLAQTKSTPIQCVECISSRIIRLSGTHKNHLPDRVEFTSVVYFSSHKIEVEFQMMSFYPSNGSRYIHEKIPQSKQEESGVTYGRRGLTNRGYLWVKCLFKWNLNHVGIRIQLSNFVWETVACPIVLYNSKI